MSIVDITPDISPDVGAADQATLDAQAVDLDLTRPTSAVSETERPSQDTSQIPGVRPTFTITEAATACAVSRKTITRKLSDLAEHGAAKDEDGVWRIPVEALLAVGLHPGRSVPLSGRAATRPRPPADQPRAPGAAGPTAVQTLAPAPTPGRGQVATAPDVVTIPRDRWDDLRLRLARAEAEAAERALALADARLALRALTAAPDPRPHGAGALGSAPSGHASPTPGVPGIPAAVGWVMGSAVPQSRAGGASSESADPAADPGAAPPVTVVPEPPRKRRWWQSAPR